MPTLETHHILIPNEEAMESFGDSLAKVLTEILKVNQAKNTEAFKKPIVLFLQGDLGAGKTTIVRGFLRGLGFQGKVKSPTFTLVEEYDFQSPGTVYHFDLYRVDSPEELNLIGIRDYFKENSISIIEWPEKGGGLLMNPDINFKIRIPNSGEGEGRDIELQASSSLGQEFLSSLMSLTSLDFNAGLTRG